LIEVLKITNEIFQVTVIKDSRTIHKVTLSDKFYKDLSDSKVSKTELIKKSFEFLLERESNQSILKEFNLKVIEGFFPDYPTLIKNYFN
tara:strand:- start:2667 stop:2933 length:267 start_codon:yes stop_codon:yes gene_type:complete